MTQLGQPEGPPSTDLTTNQQKALIGFGLSSLTIAIFQLILTCLYSTFAAYPPADDNIGAIIGTVFVSLPTVAAWILGISNALEGLSGISKSLNMRVCMGALVGVNIGLGYRIFACPREHWYSYLFGALWPMLLGAVLGLLWGWKIFIRDTEVIALEG